MKSPNGNGNGKHCRVPDIEAGRRFLAALYSEEAATEVSGNRIGEYLIVGELNNLNSFDEEVYAVVKKGSDQPRAMSIARRPATSESEIAIVCQELEKLRSVNPYFVPAILDIGVHDNRPYVVTTMTNGARLCDYCKRRSLSTRERVALTVRIPREIHQLHEHAILHTRLNPNQILVDAHEECHILGLTASSSSLIICSEEKTTLPDCGELVAFLAPELARGKKTLATTRTDVYGLGAIAYHVLTEETPHPTTIATEQLRLRVGAEQVRFSAAAGSRLPKPVASILAKSMSLNPSNRYATALEFAQDLSNWLERQPLTGVRYGTVQRLLLWCRRHPLLAALWMAMMIAALFAAFLAGRHLSQSSPQDTRDPNLSFVGEDAGQVNSVPARHDTR